MLRKPVRNLPSVSDRHKCELSATATINGVDTQIDLTDMLACKQAELANGEIFTCEAIVTVGGKEQVCGKEWVLHYPTNFAWKARRTPKDDAAATNAPAQEAAQEPAQEPAQPSGKRKH